MIEPRDQEVLRSIMRNELRDAIKPLDERQDRMEARLTKIERDLYGSLDERSGPRSLYEMVEQMQTNLQANTDVQSARVAEVEGWIRRRVAIERGLLSLGGSALVAWARRWIPLVLFLLVFVGTPIGVFALFVR